MLLIKKSDSQVEESVNCGYNTSHGEWHLDGCKWYLFWVFHSSQSFQPRSLKLITMFAYMLNLSSSHFYIKVFKKFVSRFHIFHLHFQQRVPILCDQPLPYYQPRDVKFILIKMTYIITVFISKVKFFFSQVSFNLKIIFFNFTTTF